MTACFTLSATTLQAFSRHTPAIATIAERGAAPTRRRTIRRFDYAAAPPSLFFAVFRLLLPPLSPPPRCRRPTFAERHGSAPLEFSAFFAYATMLICHGQFSPDAEAAFAAVLYAPIARFRRFLHFRSLRRRSEAISSPSFSSPAQPPSIVTPRDIARHIGRLHLRRADVSPYFCIFCHFRFLPEDVAQFSYFPPD